MLEFDADHQPLSADRHYIRGICQLHAQSGKQAFALEPGVFQQLLFFDDLQNGASDPARPRVTTERAAVAAGGKQVGNFTASQAGTDLDASGLRSDRYRLPKLRSFVDFAMRIWGRH